MNAVKEQKSYLESRVLEFNKIMRSFRASYKLYKKKNTHPNIKDNIRRNLLQQISSLRYLQFLIEMTARYLESYESRPLYKRIRKTNLKKILKSI